MSDALSITLTNPQQGHAELTARLWPWVKSMLFAGHRLTLTAKPEKRSDAQNRLLHSRFNDISKQVEWAGAKRDTEVWKRLLTAAWLRARGESIEVLPALDGHGIDVVFRRTSDLTRKECGELADYVMAWGDCLPTPVRWSLASLGADAVDPESGEILMREAA